MKKALLIVLLLCSTSMFGQSTRDVVTLKNGSVIRGEIVEQIPGESLKIRTRDGSVFVYKIDEVERINKEEATRTDVKYSGLVFSANTGYDINTKGGGGAIATEIEIGKQFSPLVYAGLGVGANFATSDGGSTTIPITLNTKVFMPLENSKIRPFAMLKGGYSINTDDGDYNAVLLQIMPGVQFPLSKSIDMNFGAGYTHYLLKEGNGGAVSIRMGFQFHNSANHQKKVLLPSVANVYQITLEGSVSNPVGIEDDEFTHYGGNIVGTYKLTPTVMAGVGIGLGTSEFDNEGEIDYMEHTDAFSASYKQIFARGIYRLTDKKFSPFASCDIGIRSHSVSTDAFKDALEAVDESKSFTSLFVNPGVGFSIRTSQNSYLDFTASYYLSGKQKWDKLNVKTSSMSGFLLKIGFTRTLVF